MFHVSLESLFPSPQKSNNKYPTWGFCSSESFNGTRKIPKRMLGGCDDTYWICRLLSAGCKIDCRHLDQKLQFSKIELAVSATTPAADLRWFLIRRKNLFDRLRTLESRSLYFFHSPWDSSSSFVFFLWCDRFSQSGISMRNVTISALKRAFALKMLPWRHINYVT